MMPEPTFETFLARLRQGDDPAVGLLCERFAAHLCALARRRLDARLRGKVDPEDVVNSALRSLCLRLRDGQFAVDDWDSLCGLLVTITLRKCGRWRDYFLTAGRNVARETALGSKEGPSGFEPAAHVEQPGEELLLEETIREMTRGLDEQQCRFVQLAIDGHTVSEISRQCGQDYLRVWRTLQLVRQRLERLRHQGDEP